MACRASWTQPGRREVRLRIEEVGIHERGEEQAQEKLGGPRVALDVRRYGEGMGWLEVPHHSLGAAQRPRHRRVAGPLVQPRLQVGRGFQAAVVCLDQEGQEPQARVARVPRPGRLMVGAAAPHVRVGLAGEQVRAEVGVELADVVPQAKIVGKLARPEVGREVRRERGDVARMFREPLPPPRVVAGMGVEHAEPRLACARIRYLHGSHLAFLCQPFRLPADGRA